MNLLNYFISQGYQHWDPFCIETSIGMYYYRLEYLDQSAHFSPRTGGSLRCCRRRTATWAERPARIICDLGVVALGACIIVCISLGRWYSKTVAHRTSGQTGGQKDVATD